MNDLNINKEKSKDSLDTLLSSWKNDTHLQLNASGDNYRKIYKSLNKEDRNIFIDRYNSILDSNLSDHTIETASMMFACVDVSLFSKSKFHSIDKNFTDKADKIYNPSSMIVYPAVGSKQKKEYVDYTQKLSLEYRKNCWSLFEDGLYGDGRYSVYGHMKQLFRHFDQEKKIISGGVEVQDTFAICKSSSKHKDNKQLIRNIMVDDLSNELPNIIQMHGMFIDKKFLDHQVFYDYFTKNNISIDQALENYSTEVMTRFAGNCGDDVIWKRPWMNKYLINGDFRQCSDIYNLPEIIKDKGKLKQEIKDILELVPDTENK